MVDFTERSRIKVKIEDFDPSNHDFPAIVSQLCVRFQISESCIEYTTFGRCVEVKVEGKDFPVLAVAEWFIYLLGNVTILTREVHYRRYEEKEI